MGLELPLTSNYCTVLPSDRLGLYFTDRYIVGLRICIICSKLSSAPLTIRHNKVGADWCWR